MSSLNSASYTYGRVTVCGVMPHGSVISSLMLTECEVTLLRSMPYWHYGPSYARNPLLVISIGEYDNV